MYRADIDGLRAIAVLCVLFYHADISPFSGGFVGVDVFFVISGFLITRLLRSQISEGSFSFANFYIRRVRRLFPALFATMALTLAGGIVLLSPDDLARLGKATVFATLSISNILFWQEAGYFDVGGDLKPLLHTWSLGVEEQFYLIWPSLIFLLARFGRDAVTLMLLLLMGIVSLLLTEWFLPIDSAAAFYLTPFRICQFVVGALMVWLVPHRPERAAVLELASLLGFALVLYPAVAFSASTPFPGFNALVPSVGAALLIYSGQSRLAGRILSNRLAVGLGLISYSLYLVHWPVIVLYKYAGVGVLAEHEKWGLIGVSVALATVSYFAIEQPFRRPKSSGRSLSPPAFGLAASALAIGLMFPAAHIWGEGGWPWRFNELTTELPTATKMWTARNEKVRLGRCFILQENSFAHFDVESCLAIESGKPNYLIIGDSLAADTYMVMTRALPEVNFLQATVGNCRPLLGNTESETCRDLLDYVLEDFLPSASIDGVILSGSWTHIDTDGLDGLLQRLDELRIRAIVVGSTVRYLKAVPTHVAQSGSRDIDEITEFAHSQIHEHSRSLNQVLRRRMVGRADFLDYYEMLCTPICRIFTEQDELIYIDWGHLTVAGGSYAASLVRDRYGDLFRGMPGR